MRSDRYVFIRWRIKSFITDSSSIVNKLNFQSLFFVFFVDVDVDLTTEVDEQLAVSPSLQPVTPSAVPDVDRRATCSTDEDDDGDEWNQFVINTSQVAYASFPSSSSTVEIECIE